MPELPRPTETSFVLGVWFVGWGVADWLCTAWEDDGKVFATYRFRYYAGSDPHDNNDLKNWYAITGPSREKLMAACHQVASMTAANYDAHINDFIEVNGDTDKMVELMAPRPWCHIKSEGSA